MCIFEPFAMRGYTIATIRTSQITVRKRLMAGNSMLCRTLLVMNQAVSVANRDYIGALQTHIRAL